MDALTVGYILLAIIVLAFFASFYNFQSKTQRRLSQYELDKTSLTDDLKRAQRGREKEQAVIDQQNWALKESEERIRSLEEKVAKLDHLADRVEALGERYARLIREEGDDSAGD